MADTNPYSEQISTTELLKHSLVVTEYFCCACAMIKGFYRLDWVLVEFLCMPHHSDLLMTRSYIGTYAGLIIVPELIGP